ncbi:hypothetical protein CYMTET_34646 [Cymbomonas tetramitiformis]|uniref:Uncharacterized protein n=1 Tax=Cymbomonas tetramitiformis TaxID=36881 RepID=A0AAE0FAR3_9CHLO|nr:hypothetical protein CYMTET_34646 [Cymbomonas tetramitiformis]
MITACVVLHNFVQRRHPEFHEFAHSRDEGCRVPNPPAAVVTVTPKTIRERYVHYVNHNRNCLKYRKSKQAMFSINRVLRANTAA